MADDDARWLYDLNGTPAFLQRGDTIFRGSQSVYYISDGWWFPMSGGPGEFYISEGWVFTKSGKQAYYYSDD